MEVPAGFDARPLSAHRQRDRPAAVSRPPGPPRLGGGEVPIARLVGHGRGCPRRRARGSRAYDGPIHSRHRSGHHQQRVWPTRRWRPRSRGSRCCRFRSLSRPARSSRGPCCRRSRIWPAGTRRAAGRWTCLGPSGATSPSASSPGGRRPRCPSGPSGRPSRGWPTAASIATSRSCLGARRPSVPKISPVTASQRYLEHLVAAWEAAFPACPVAPSRSSC